jgi:hypothetical protein
MEEDTGERGIAMKIYIVTSGSYSDYSIVGVFTDRDMAEKMAAATRDSNGVEEWDTDILPDKVAQGYKPYRVEFGPNWRTSGDVGRISIDSPYFADEGYIYAQDGEGMWRAFLIVCCWAKDEEGAAKIANEKRVQMAEGELR